MNEFHLQWKSLRSRWDINMQIQKPPPHIIASVHQYVVVVLIVIQDYQFPKEKQKIGVVQVTHKVSFEAIVPVQLDKS